MSLPFLRGKTNYTHIIYKPIWSESNIRLFEVVIQLPSVAALQDSLFIPGKELENRSCSYWEGNWRSVGGPIQLHKVDGLKTRMKKECLKLSPSCLSHGCYCADSVVCS